MKISKARLRQIINESYQKILLQENPAIVIGGITLTITASAVSTAILITLAGIVICHLYKLHRTAFEAPEVFEANDILKDGNIVRLLSGARQWAIENGDNTLVAELDKAKNLSRELISDLDLTFGVDTAAMSTIDFSSSIFQITRYIGKTASTSGLGALGVLTAGYEVANFELKLGNLDEEKVRLCMNTIQGVVNIARQIDNKTIGKSL